MIYITIHGGINEIGGNKILLEDKGHDVKVFLDFGKSFKAISKYYQFPFHRPQTISELIEIGAIPLIENLYSVEVEKKKNFDFSRDPEPPIQGVVVSHGHMDHVGHITLLSRRTKIYMGYCCHKIFNAYGKVSRAYSVDTIFDGIEHNICDFRTGEIIRIGELEIKPIHVDHSIPGAYGFIVFTSEGPIIYTGDFRLHGSTGLTEDFINSIEDLRYDTKILCLITEATHIDFSGYVSEDEVERKLSELFSRINGNIIADFSRTDIDRFFSFLYAAKRTGRKLVIDWKRYIIIREILEARLKRKYTVKDFEVDPDILVIAKEKERYYYLEEKKLFERLPEDKKITISEIAKRDNLIMVLSTRSTSALAEIGFPRSCVYIMASSEPFSEESEITFEKVKNWLEILGVPIYYIHASGHIQPLDLREFINRVQPRIVIPVHSEKPLLLKNFIRKFKWIIPTKGERIKISSLEL
mgnify:FL=1